MATSHCWQRIRSRRLRPIDCCNAKTPSSESDDESPAKSIPERVPAMLRGQSQRRRPSELLRQRLIAEFVPHDRHRFWKFFMHLLRNHVIQRLKQDRRQWNAKVSSFDKLRPKPQPNAIIQSKEYIERNMSCPWWQAGHECVHVVITNIVSNVFCFCFESLFASLYGVFCWTCAPDLIATMSSQSYIVIQCT